VRLESSCGSSVARLMNGGARDRGGWSIDARPFVGGLQGDRGGVGHASVVVTEAIGTFRTVNDTPRLSWIPLTSVNDCAPGKRSPRARYM